METSIQIAVSRDFDPFPDYFKSELMETLLSLALVTVSTSFPDYFKSELMETAAERYPLSSFPFPITSNRN